MIKINTQAINNGIQVVELLSQKCTENNLNSILQELNLIFKSSIESCTGINLYNDGNINSEVMVIFKLYKPDSEENHQYWNFELDYKKNYFDVEKEVNYVIDEILCNFNKEKIKEKFKI